MKKTMLVDEGRNKVLSRLVSAFERLIPTQVINMAADGTPYIQTIGEPVRELTVKAFVTPSQMPLVDEAWALTNLCSVTIGKVKKYGYITNVSPGERMAQGWREVTITMTEVEVQ